MALSASKLKVGDTHTARLVEDLKRTQIVQYAGASGGIIIEFLVDDVDKQFERLREHLTDIVLEPTTMPWGNRSTLFRDPDGNLVNLFTRPA